MANRSSALESNYPVGVNATNNESRLQLSEIKNLQLTQVASWPDSINKVGSYIANHLNLNEYATPNKAIINHSVVMMRIEPLKWWIIGSDVPALSSDDGTSLDLSHSFTHLEISGPSASLFLNRHLPLDLREKHFLVNSVASSAIHHVSVKLWRSDTGYHLFIPRGFALSLWAIFLETASQFGYEIN
jgi:heterotetrameric sarcosine oxidase gamma subunit